MSRIMLLRRTIAGPLLALAAVALLVGGCGRILEPAPAPTPLDFPGVASQLSLHGITLDKIASGDPGCPGSTLAATAIRFSAAGLDQASPVIIYLYIFNDGAAYDRRRQDVDTCARSYVTDPATLESIDASPYVAMGQGPWAPRFAAALRAALAVAAGTPGSSAGS